MAKQLVGHAVRRIELLESITQALSRFPAASAHELTRVLAANAWVQRAAPVEQACMTGGPVELF